MAPDRRAKHGTSIPLADLFQRDCESFLNFFPQLAEEKLAVPFQGQANHSLGILAAPRPISSLSGTMLALFKCLGEGYPIHAFFRIPGGSFP